MRPYINKLFARIEKDDVLRDNVKLIGIAAGNDIYEIELDKKLYDFPVIPDDYFIFHQQVGQPPTPFLIVAQAYRNGSLLVTDSHLGRTEDVDKLFSMVTAAYEKSIRKSEIAIRKKQKVKQVEKLILPISEKELMQKVRKSLVVKGVSPVKITKIDLQELGDVYTGVLSGSKRRVFARVVARKIPCVDCHDVFYIYSFDDKGAFLNFISIDISKLDNEQWDDKDIQKMISNFKGTSLLIERRFRPKVDAISSATISSKVVFDSMGETAIVIKNLIDLGYISKKAGGQL